LDAHWNKNNTDDKEYCYDFAWSEDWLQRSQLLLLKWGIWSAEIEAKF